LHLYFLFFQFVDLAPGETSKDLKSLKDEVQKLTESWSLEHGEIKTIQKEMGECRTTTNMIREEMKQMKEEKIKMQERMKLLETKNEEFLMILNALKESMSKMKLASTVIPTVISSSQSCDNQVKTSYEKEKEKEKGQEKEKEKELDNENVTPVLLRLKELDKSQCYTCKDCGTDIALENDIISRCYQVGQGAFTEKKTRFSFQFHG